jgi:dihydroxyacetone kinase
VWCRLGQSIKEAAEAAVNGAERTKIMESLAGRSNYISQDQLEGVPDPGAVAVSLAFETIANSVQKR